MILNDEINSILEELKAEDIISLNVKGNNINQTKDHL